MSGPGIPTLLMTPPSTRRRWSISHEGQEAPSVVDCCIRGKKHGRQDARSSVGTPLPSCANFWVWGHSAWFTGCRRQQGLAEEIFS